MPSGGLRGLLVRGLAAGAACVLALASTSAMVSAAVVGHGAGSPAVLTSQGGEGGGNGQGNGDGSQGQGNGDGSGHGIGLGHGSLDASYFAALIAKLRAGEVKVTAPKPVVTRPRTVPRENTSTNHAVPAHPAAPATHQQTAAAPAPTVVVDSSDPAPFSAQAVSAAEASRVLPVESLGPLSGISFGSGLFIWPVLLAVDVLALAVIARLALRRRLASPED